MPILQVNSTNIKQFGFSVSFDMYNRTVTFNISNLTLFQGGGAVAVSGCYFELRDSQGVYLAQIALSAPQIEPSLGETTFVIDLSGTGIEFFVGNTYTIKGAVIDSATPSIVYYTDPVVKTLCEPTDLNESGYVNGVFQLMPDCTNNVLTVKDLTPYVYCGEKPKSTTKSGTLYYPTGTINPVTFTGTPFQNNDVFTGENRVNCTSVATYDLKDEVYSLVTYKVNSPFDVVCGDFLGDITCCVSEVLNLYKANCENAVGKAALEKYNRASPLLLNGLIKQINGQDASVEAAEIRKILNCNCGHKGAIRQNEQNPANPNNRSIIVTGTGGSSVTSSTNGNTVTYNVFSSIYKVVKGDDDDLAFTISVDTVSETGAVKYVITINYDVFADKILTEFETTPSYISRLQNLLVTSLDLSGVNGLCVVDTLTKNYTLQRTSVTSQTKLVNIVANGTPYAAPSNTFATNATAVQNWLNSISVGVFAVTYNSGIITITSSANTNTLSTVTFIQDSVEDTVAFQSSSKTLTELLNYIFSYLCNLTDLQVDLGAALTLYSFDYNSNILQSTYPIGTPQSTLNNAIVSDINDIINRINSLTGVTCAKIKTLFIDRPSVTFGTADRLYGTLGGDCAGITDYQLAGILLAAVNKYTDIKTAFCAIDCKKAGTCPEISAVSANVVSGDIGIYGVTFATAATANQTLTVRYKLASATSWTVATNNLSVFPSGTISGTSPYLIIGPIAGQTYDINVSNNCGGTGFTTQLTVPTETIYTGSYYLDNIVYTICGVSPVTLYSVSPFGSGVTMYSDIGLTTPVTGYTYITQSGSNIFAINTSTGVVGVDTGNACSNGTAGSYILGNSTATICSGTPVTLYTNGAFTVGGVLYTDSSLTTPVTGYAYVVDGSSNAIYNLNTSTGTVGVPTSLSCNFAVGRMGIGDCVTTGSITGVTFDGNTIVAAYPLVSGDGQQVNTIANTTATMSVTATGTFSSISVTDSFGTVYCQNSVGAGVYNFPGVIIDPNGTSNFGINMACTAC